MKLSENDLAIKIEMLRSFCEVARVGNIVEAADRIGRTPSALSMTLKQLEAELGGQLFIGERKNHLSELGHQLNNIAQIQIRNFDETLRHIENLARAPQGIIRVAAIPSMAGELFTEVLAPFAAKYPSIQLELRDSDTASIFEMLSQGQIDLGLASGDQKLNRTICTPLFSDKIGLVCSKNNPISQKKPSFEQICEADYLMNNIALNLESELRARLELNAKMTVFNTMSLIHIISRTNWVSILPQSVINLAPNALQFIEIEEIKTRRQVSLYTQENPILEQFISELKIGCEMSFCE